MNFRRPTGGWNDFGLKSPGSSGRLFRHSSLPREVPEVDCRSTVPPQFPQGFATVVVCQRERHVAPPGVWGGSSSLISLNGGDIRYHLAYGTASCGVNARVRSPGRARGRGPRAVHAKGS